MSKFRSDYPEGSLGYELDKIEHTYRELGHTLGLAQVDQLRTHMAYRRNQTLAIYCGVDFAELQAEAQDRAFTAWKRQERLNGNDAYWNLYIAAKRLKWVLAGPILRHLGRLLRKLTTGKPEHSGQTTSGAIYRDESNFCAENQIATDARLIAVWDHKTTKPES
ncbi:MAG: hypothetical protein IKE39_04135 [Cutibacterium sp.]|nr:hypothetical protein [Renibacterium sp.]MBR2580291.1 hypothetical protein [Cutibacterium sp.]